MSSKFKVGDKVYFPFYTNICRREILESLDNNMYIVHNCKIPLEGEYLHKDVNSLIGIIEDLADTDTMLEERPCDDCPDKS